MKINENYFGFTLQSEEYLKDIDSTAKIFYHEKSGARLLSLENNDDNKVFGVGFRTPPNDSTGVAHILEHSVLNGSRKYRTKEPFMSLVKGSLATFINAMTYPDKTIYPVASRNNKDYINLMDVYLDAVFYPAVHHKKEIFLQEGWHYELDSKDGDITYKGVVYNEMRGAFSSPNEAVFYELSKGLFPDTIYRHESGGEPYQIPELTYEGLVDFHKKYYHPSNSYIYLYGNMDLSERLEYLDKEYLSNFDRIEIDSSIGIQKPFDEPHYVNSQYSLAPDDDPTNKDMLVYGLSLGEKSDMINYYVGEVLNEVLFANDASPVKVALLESEIAEDIDDISFAGKEAAMAVSAINSSVDRLDEFQRIIEETLKKIAEEGIDKQQLEAAINKFEYSFRECNNFPTPGIIYMIQALDTWLYDQSPTIKLKYDDILKELRAKLDTSFYEEYLVNKIINNNHKVIIGLTGKPGLNDEKDKKVFAQLQEYKKSLSEKELEDLVEENRILKEFQEKEDTEEEMATIPSLSVKDVDPNIGDIPTKIIQEDDHTILYNPLFTSGINNLELAFNLDFITEEEIPYLSLLCDTLSMMDTKNYDYKKLSTKIFLETGGIRFSTLSYTDSENPCNYINKLYISSKSTAPKVANMLELIEEIISSTEFENKKRLKEIIQMIKIKHENDLVDNGHTYGILKVNSYFSQQGMFIENLSGIAYYDFIKDLDGNLDERFDHVKSKLEYLFKKIFVRNKLIVNLTVDESLGDELITQVKGFISNLSEDKHDPYELNFDISQKNEGIMTSSNVNYVTMGGKLGDEYKYKGRYEVLANIINNGYLYSKIRAQGGAYGQGFSIMKKGIFILFSYRDPNVAESLDVYNNLPQEIENLEMSDKEFNDCIIGSVSKFDPPMTNATKGKLALNMYISHQNMDDVREALRDALSADIQSLKDIVKPLQSAIDKNIICVVGNTQKIKESEDRFISIRPLNK